MRIFFECDPASIRDTQSTINSVIENVHSGTKWATELSCKIIFEESQYQVPVDTGTLARSGFYRVERRSELAKSSYRYRGIIGYGGNNDPVNPKSYQRASHYARTVHEDLDAYHPNGKAKYLEDPLYDFASRGELYAVFKECIKRGIRSI